MIDYKLTDAQNARLNNIADRFMALRALGLVGDGFQCELSDDSPDALLNDLEAWIARIESRLN